MECIGWQKFCNKKGLGRIGWLSGHIVRKVWKVGVCVCFFGVSSKGSEVYWAKRRICNKKSLRVVT